MLENVICQSLMKNKKAFNDYFEIIFSVKLYSYLTKILKKKGVVELFKRKPLTKISPLNKFLKGESDDLW